MFTGQGSEGGHGDWDLEGCGGTRLLSPLPILTTRRVRRHPPHHQSPPPVPHQHRPNPEEQRRGLILSLNSEC